MLLPLEYHFPDSIISSKDLDRLLASGYFRTGNYMMRTRVLYFNDEILNTLHIRIVLEEHFFSKSLYKILKRNNAKFTYKIQPLNITDEKETLYKIHRKRFKGNASASLMAYLYDNIKRNIFNTLELNIYEEGKLIGFSFFDLGEDSMASIIGIYHQEYANNSLGIYTMLLEIEYAKFLHLKYYYPGYVTYEPSQFNYKQRLSNQFEFYDWHTKQWLSFEYKNDKIRINELYKTKLDEAIKWLNHFKIPNRILFYPFFYMGSMYPKSDCVKGVHHLLLEDFDIEGLFYIIEFNPEKMELLLSGVTIHKYQFEERIDFFDIFNNQQWNRVLLYIHPSIVIRNEYEFFSGYIFLQDLFRQHLQPPPIPSNYPTDSKSTN